MDEGFEVFGDEGLLTQNQVRGVVAVALLLLLALIFLLLIPGKSGETAGLETGSLISKKLVMASCNPTRPVHPSSDLRVDLVDGSLGFDEIDCEGDRYLIEIETDTKYGVVPLKIDERSFDKLEVGDEVAYKLVGDSDGLMTFEFVKIVR